MTQLTNGSPVAPISNSSNEIRQLKTAVDNWQWLTLQVIQKVLIGSKVRNWLFKQNTSGLYRPIKGWDFFVYLMVSYLLALIVFASTSLILNPSLLAISSTRNSYISALAIIFCLYSIFATIFVWKEFLQKSSHIPTKYRICIVMLIIGGALIYPMFLPLGLVSPFSLFESWQLILLWLLGCFLLIPFLTAVNIALVHILTVVLNFLSFHQTTFSDSVKDLSEYPFENSSNSLWTSDIHHIRLLLEITQNSRERTDKQLIVIGLSTAIAGIFFDALGAISLLQDNVNKWIDTLVTIIQTQSDVGSFLQLIPLMLVLGVIWVLGEAIIALLIHLLAQNILIELLSAVLRIKEQNEVQQSFTLQLPQEIQADISWGGWHQKRPYWLIKFVQSR